MGGGAWGAYGMPANPPYGLARRVNPVGGFCAGGGGGVFPAASGRSYAGDMPLGLGGFSLELGFWKERQHTRSGRGIRARGQRHPRARARDRAFGLDRPIAPVIRTVGREGPPSSCASGVAGSVHRRNPDCVQRPRRSAPPSYFSRVLRAARGLWRVRWRKQRRRSCGRRRGCLC